MSGAPSSEFWNFSLSLYTRPGVAEELIDLQDRFGADVNVLLFCCWCGTTGRRPLDTALLAQAMDMTAAWQQRVVVRLRAIRRDMKGGVPGVPMTAGDALREEIKRLEIEGERLEQRILSDLAPAPQGEGSGAEIRAALTAYLMMLDDRGSSDFHAAVDRLVATCIS